MSPDDIPPNYPRLMFQRYTPRFEAVDYVTALNGPFDMNVPLQAAMQEAEAKDCVVVVQLALVPAVEFYAPLPEEKAEGSNDEAGQ